MVEESKMENLQICVLCGGKCCKRVPGEWSVKDVLARAVSLEAALNKMIDEGLVQFDWWMGDVEGEKELSRVYYPRGPVTTNRSITHGSWGHDPCALLAPTGCRLGHDKRPQGCRDLTPSEDFSCEPVEGGYEKRVAAKEWRAYQKEIENVISSK
jgi:hypothetical protein